MRLTRDQAEAAFAAAVAAEAEAAEWAGVVAGRVLVAADAVASAKEELSAAKAAEKAAKLAAREAKSARVRAKEVVQEIETDAQMLVYAAQGWAECEAPDVVAARPFRQWRSAGDSRVCSACAVMDGVTWRRDDPTFAEAVPPRAFGCRCTTITLANEDLVEGGCRVSTMVPPGFAVEPGYGVEGIRRVLAELKAAGQR